MSKLTHRLKIKNFCSSIIILTRRNLFLNFKHDDDEVVIDANIHRKTNYL